MFGELRRDGRVCLGSAALDLQPPVIHQFSPLCLGAMSWPEQGPQAEPSERSFGEDEHQLGARFLSRSAIYAGGAAALLLRQNKLNIATDGGDGKFVLRAFELVWYEVGRKMCVFVLAVEAGEI